MKRVLTIISILFIYFLYCGFAFGSDKDIKSVQWSLIVLEYNPGKPDGVIGPNTQKAVEKFQTHHKLPVTGSLDDETITKIKKVADEHYNCLKSVTAELSSKFNGKIEFGYMTSGQFVGVIKIPPTFYIEETRGSTEEILTKIQEFVEDEKPKNPLVLKCNQSAYNYDKN